jgi:protein-tyrosine phosphatase
VFASASWIYSPEIPADVVLYLDESWASHGEVIDWPDGSVPRDQEAARRLIREAFAAAREGRRVEVGCIAGHGRTGTVLACMAIVAGVPAERAIEWVRDNYCEKAVETGPQERWIVWFGEGVAGGRDGVRA